MPRPATRPGVADLLAEAILSGHYRPGDFIPKEVELCATHGLNRPAVRSELRRLVEAGVIERISGHGSRVRDYAQWNILDPTLTAWMTRYATPTPAILHQILAFRLDVEPYVAMIAARQASARDLVMIEEAFEGMALSLTSPSDDRQACYSEHDVAFHTAIYKATHNIVWSQLSHILRPAIQLLVTTSNVSTADPLESLERHRRLMECIRARQADDAFRTAQAVLQDTAAALGIAPASGSLGQERLAPR